MSTLAWVALALAVTPNDSPTAVLYPEVQAVQHLAERSYGDWAVELRDALRREARAKDQQRLVAFAALVELSSKLAKPNSLSDSQRSLLQAKLNRRLARSAVEIQRDLTKRALRLRRFQDQNAPRSIRSQLIEDRAVLAQFQQLIGGPAAGEADEERRLDALIQRIINPDDWQPNGGAGVMALFQRGGGGAGGRLGAEGAGLVDLIQQVIEPDTWEPNGGPGTIMLFGQ